MGVASRTATPITVASPLQRHGSYGDEAAATVKATELLQLRTVTRRKAPKGERFPLMGKRRVTRGVTRTVTNRKLAWTGTREVNERGKRREKTDVEERKTERVRECERERERERGAA